MKCIDNHQGTAECGRTDTQLLADRMEAAEARNSGEAVCEDCVAAVSQAVNKPS